MKDIDHKDITTMYFVRHGQVYNPRHVIYERLPGFHLSQIGRIQVMRSAQFLIHEHIAENIVALYSSPLERTCETAQIIVRMFERSTGHIVHIQKDERLIEAGNSFRGQVLARGKAALWRIHNWRRYLDLGTPGWGEPYSKIAQRMVAFTEEKADEYAGRNIVVVSHESPIWTLRAMLSTGKPQTSIFGRQQALASITRICMSAHDHQLVSIDYVDLNTSRQWQHFYPVNKI